MRILVAGEVLFDIINGVPHLGGAPLNTAIHLAALGHEVYIFSFIGNDSYGSRARAFLKNRSVHTDFLFVHATLPTGTVDVELHNGIPSYTIHLEAAWANMSLLEPVLSTIKAMHFDAFVFGSLAQYNKNNLNLMQEMLSNLKCTEVLFDVNIRKQFYTKEIIEKSLAFSTIYKITKDELELLMPLANSSKVISREAFLQNLFDENKKLKIIVITDGANGADIVYKNLNTANLNCVHEDAASWEHKDKDPVTNAIIIGDTVGAGDAFNAGFLNAVLNRVSYEKALKAGCLLGAYVANKTGATPVLDYEIKLHLQDIIKL